MFPVFCRNFVPQNNFFVKISYSQKCESGKIMAQNFDFLFCLEFAEKYKKGLVTIFCIKVSYLES